VTEQLTYVQHEKLSLKGHAVLNEQHPATYSSDVTFAAFPLKDEIARGIKPSLGTVSVLPLTDQP